MSGFELQRLGLLMEPEPGNPQEIEGVLNPAAVRGPDGEGVALILDIDLTLREQPSVADEVSSL